MLRALIFVLAIAAQDDWSRLMQQAKTQIATGDENAAVQSYRQALQRASDEQKVSTQIALADLLSHFEGNEQLREARSLYEQLIPIVPTPRKYQVQNNYGVLLMRLKDFSAATSQLQDLVEKSGSVDVGKNRAFYLYNLGKAHEQSGKLESAVADYRLSATLDSTLVKASDAALQLSLRLKPDLGLKECTSLINQRIAAFDLQGSKRYLQTALGAEQWYRQAEYRHLLVSLVRYFTTAKTEPAEFEKEWRGVLRKARLNTVSPSSERIDQISRIFLDKPSTTPDTAPFMSAWRDDVNDGVKPLSAFTKSVGDIQAANNRPQFALGQYMLAWELDRTNMDAGLYLVNVLLESGKEVDPNEAILNRFIGRLFDVKGEAYLGSDWQNILRFHTLLATIYERKEKWGPIGDPRSAAYQLDHAKAAWIHVKEEEDRVLSARGGRGRGGSIAAAGGGGAFNDTPAARPTPAAVPALDLKRAAVYEKIGIVGLAVSAYIEAAFGYVDLKSAAEARNTLSRIDSFNPSVLSDAQKTQLSTLRTRISAM
jgi:Tfp pilus assembly protein PilF